MIKKATPILPSLNEAETIRFYTERLGFTFVFNNNGYLIFVRDGINVHLWPCTEPSQAINCGCYLYVSDIEDIYTEYQAHNLIHPNGPLKQMAWGRQFAVVDNNGNIIYIADYKEI